MCVCEFGRSCHCCKFLSPFIIRISQCKDFLSKYMYAQNQIDVIYTCMYYSFYHHSIITIIIVILQKVSSRVFKYTLTHSHSINCGEKRFMAILHAMSYTLSVLTRKKRIVAANFSLYNILFHCPLQQKSFKFLLFYFASFILFLSHSPLSNQMDLIVNVHIYFKMLIYFTVA